MKSKSLSNLQMELLKLYSTDLNEDELRELKIILAENYAKKAVKEADDIYVKLGLNDNDMESWINES
jgi:hypothetical protein